MRPPHVIIDFKDTICYIDKPYSQYVQYLNKGRKTILAGGVTIECTVHGLQAQVNNGTFINKNNTTLIWKLKQIINFIKYILKK